MSAFVERTLDAASETASRIAPRVVPKSPPLPPIPAVLTDEVVPAGEPWMGVLQKGHYLRIVDLAGNQPVDALFYSAATFEERYSASDTVRAQGNLYLTKGTRLLSNHGNTMLQIVADTCGRHATLGGACSAESNTVRFSLEKRHMHSCRDNFLQALARADCGLGKRDLSSNVNFFTNVPVTPGGQLAFAEGVSAAGRYVVLRAEMDLIVLLSNCPQINSSPKVRNPTPVRLLISDSLLD